MNEPEDGSGEPQKSMTEAMAKLQNPQTFLAEVRPAVTWSLVSPSVLEQARDLQPIVCANSIFYGLVEFPYINFFFFLILKSFAFKKIIFFLFYSNSNVEILFCPLSSSCPLPGSSVLQPKYLSSVFTSLVSSHAGLDHHHLSSAVWQRNTYSLSFPPNPLVSRACPPGRANVLKHKSNHSP